MGRKKEEALTSKDGPLRKLRRRGGVRSRDSEVSVLTKMPFEKRGLGL